MRGLIGAIAAGMILTAAESAEAACPRDRLVVALDIGHGPDSPGATSARGRPEYAFNRDLTLRLRDQMHAAGITGAFLVTTADGGAPGLWDRPRIAGARGAHALLSIHHDSVQPQFLETGTLDGRPARYSRHARGHALFVSSKNLYAARSTVLARAIGQALTDWGLTPTLHHAEPIAGENRPLLDEALGIHDFADLVVLKAAPMPAVLIEAGVIVHPEEELEAQDPFRQDLVIDGIVRGLLAACPELLAP
ncbi:N-acetylmuramoyl-L-alanine amidase [Roseospira goensis]|uniref:N-acetylmuramoyl-L-alanine amidase n=1 Tax=Roseospira goensis TaxID=391922 RepID=A0A7W6S319_9PROT|nr:N-acetylmuramoyl-L-alanine amidase [Roseospira goensis]